MAGDREDQYQRGSKTGIGEQLGRQGQKFGHVKSPGSRNKDYHMGSLLQDKSAAAAAVKEKRFAQIADKKGKPPPKAP